VPDLRLCVDVIPLLVRSAGIKGYLYHWVRHLAAAEKARGVSLFPFVPALGDLDHERSLLGRHSTTWRLALLHFVNLRGNPAIDLLQARADVFHISNQIRNLPKRTLVTTTIHDFTSWRVPETHLRANVLADMQFAEAALRRADGLIVVSESSRRDAEEILGLPPERMQVIYSGIPDAYFRAGSGEAQAAKARFHLEKPYLLYVGTIEPRKNIDGALDAYLQLPQSCRDEFDLVVAGPAGWGYEATLARLESGIPGIRYLGYVPEELMPGLTAGACLFVYPSLYEGFGFPVAQAMACGIPVVTTNVSSLPEITAGAAILVEPASVEQIRAAFMRLLDSPDTRDALGSLGRKVAQRYTWERCARESWQFFERVGGRGR
jgi:glycosyltransferase involved in cell wall biosynthesis